MEHLPSPLYGLLNQINQAAKGGLHLVAISMAVALPDICASLISEDGRTSPDRYKEWCRANLAFNFLTPEDLYSMRCGVLHNGRFGDMKHNVARVVFVPPMENGNQVADCRSNDAFLYSVVPFCETVTKAVFDWLEQNREDPFVKVNIERLMQYRNGLPPHIVGAEVIA